MDLPDSLARRTKMEAIRKGVTFRQRVVMGACLAAIAVVGAYKLLTLGRRFARLDGLAWESPLP